MTTAGTAWLAIVSLAALIVLAAFTVDPAGAADVAARPAKLLPRARNFTYFTVAPDPRMCPSPLCGGHWVAPVNLDAIACANGSPLAACYVAALDFSRSGLSDEQEALVRATPERQLLLQGSIQAQASPFGTLGVFQVQQAWIGNDDAVPSGAFVRARDNGVRCIAFPCNSVQIELLNAWDWPRWIAGVDLGPVAADPEHGYAQLGEPDGLIAAGELVPVTGPGGSSEVLRATGFYLPVGPSRTICEATDPRPCARNQFCDLGGRAECGRATVPGACDERPKACIAIYDPVCGCDGITYSSSCTAHAAGMSVAHTGRCL